MLMLLASDVERGDMLRLLIEMRVAIARYLPSFISPLFSSPVMPPHFL